MTTVPLRAEPLASPRTTAFAPPRAADLASPHTADLASPRTDLASPQVTNFTAAPVADSRATTPPGLRTRPTYAAGPHRLSRPAAPLRWPELVRRVRAALAILDIVTAVLVGLTVWLLTAGSGGWWAVGVVAALPVTVTALGGTSVRQVHRRTYGRSAVLRAGAGVGLGLLAVAQVSGAVPPAEVTVVALPATVAAMYLCRAGAAGWVRRYGHRRPPRAVVVGTEEHLSAFLDRQREHSGYELVGRCAVTVGDQSFLGDQLEASTFEQRLSSGMRSESAVGSDPALPILGTAAELAEIVTRHHVDTVLVAGTLPEQQLRSLSTSLHASETALVLVPGVVEVGLDRVHVLPGHGAWDVQLLVEPRRQAVPGKGLLDRALGALLLLPAAPLIAVAALAVRMTSPGPAFYEQTRVGLDGRRFRMWKLRSMVDRADAQQAELQQENDCDGVIFKMRGDPRITPIGGFLRRFSIDELPQLWNVVKGDMSLVGPRPPLPDEAEQYSGEEPRRLIVKPGLTGLWQVSGRSDLSWSDSVRLDLRYVDNWSMGMDLRILAATARAVVGGHGAY